MNFINLDRQQVVPWQQTVQHVGNMTLSTSYVQHGLDNMHRHRRDAFKLRFTTHLLLYHQHLIAKVYISMVSINTFVNTLPLLHRPHDGHTSPASSDSITARRLDTGDDIDPVRWLRLHRLINITICDDPYKHTRGPSKTVVCSVNSPVLEKLVVSLMTPSSKTYKTPPECTFDICKVHIP
jgi:hypothetical protein